MLILLTITVLFMWMFVKVCTALPGDWKGGICSIQIFLLTESEIEYHFHVIFHPSIHNIPSNSTFYYWYLYPYRITDISTVWSYLLYYEGHQRVTP